MQTGRYGTGSFINSAAHSNKPGQMMASNYGTKLTGDRISHVEEVAEKIGTGSILEMLQKSPYAAIGSQVGGWLLDAGKASIDASAQIEKYQLNLKTMLGTTTAARDRMQEYFAIAKKTPMEVNQVVEVGNGLQKLGRYSKENVNMIGDLASASGKPVEQALEAFSKLATGQKSAAVAMFKEMGVATEDWTNATGKGVSKNGELLASTDELIAVLPNVMKSKGYYGSMGLAMETTDGKVSKLQKGINGLKVAIGDRLKPSYDGMVASASNAVNAMTKWVEIPTVQKIAADKAELNLLVGVLLDHNTKQDERNSIIEQLQLKYPEFLKNIDIERISTEELRKELEKTNGEYDKRMKKSVYSGKIAEYKEKAQIAKDDMLEAETSINARAMMTKLQKEGAKYAKKNQTMWDYAGTQYKDLSPKDAAEYLMANRTGRNPKEAAEMERIASEIIAYNDFTSTLNFDESNRKNSHAEYKYYTKKAATLEAIQDREFGAEERAAAEKQRKEDARRQKEEEDAKKRRNMLSKQLEKASTVISGGGGTVKNFNIRINSLIGANTNMFNSSTDDPRTASTFMQRLSDALQSVVNDVNYAAN